MIDRDTWFGRRWRDLVLVATALTLVLLFVFALWAIFGRADEEEATLEIVQQLAEQMSRDQDELRRELLLHRCRKEQLMELLLEVHRVPIPADPHPAQCPAELR